MSKISFKIAKLAKNKGFDELCGTHYCYGSGDAKEPETGEVFVGGFLNKETGNPRFYRNSELVKWDLPYGEFSSPTQSDLQKWLRESHDIHVYCVPSLHFIDKDFDHYSFCVLNGKKLFEDDGSYHRYEDCLEAGLKYVLDYEMEYC